MPTVDFTKDELLTELDGRIRTVVREEIVAERSHTAQTIDDALVKEREHTAQTISEALAVERGHTAQMVRDEITSEREYTRIMMRQVVGSAQRETVLELKAEINKVKKMLTEDHVVATNDRTKLGKQVAKNDRALKEHLADTSAHGVKR